MRDHYRSSNVIYIYYYYYYYYYYFSSHFEMLTWLSATCAGSQPPASEVG